VGGFVAAFAVALLLVAVLVHGRAPMIVESADGSLSRISGNTVSLLHVGDTIQINEVIGSNGPGGAVIALEDGTRVEMRAHSRIAVENAADGKRIRLDGGSIIVNAAKQRNGHLYVRTKDVTVSVVGTVFLVRAEGEGSKVAVLEGKVRLQHAETEETLVQGEQVATLASMEQRPISSEITWSREAAVHAAQLQQSPVAFELASIKPADPANPRPMASRFYPGGRFTATDMPLRTLILIAYRSRIERFNLSGGPAWIDSAKFAVEAKPKAGDIPTGQLNRDSVEQIERMLQSLLADRFKLKLRSEFKEGTIYRLVVDNKGPKLKSAEKVKDCSTAVEDIALTCHTFTRIGPAGTIGQSIDMKDLAMLLRLDVLKQPVQDDTGIQGLFDVSFHWTPDSKRSTTDLRSEPPNLEPVIPIDGPDLFTALREQLGLRLEVGKGPVEFMTIESADQPSEN
jgi:uncharacterized protein (TIGR03435 family)